MRRSGRWIRAGEDIGREQVHGHEGGVPFGRRRAVGQGHHAGVVDDDIGPAEGVDLIGQVVDFIGA